MRNVKRVVLLCLIGAVGILSGFTLLQTPMSRVLEYEFLIPLSLFLLSIPSFTFNTQLYRFIAMNQDSLLLDDTWMEKRKFKPPTILPISYFLFGGLIVFYGIALFVYVQTNAPLSDFPENWERYMIILGILIFGVSMVIDIIYVHFLPPHTP